MGAYLTHKLALIAVAVLTVAASGAEVPTDKALAPVESPSGRAELVPPEIPVALLVDLSTGQTLFSRDAERRFVPASVTKVMTAYTAFRLIDEGKLSPDTMVSVSEEVAEDWSGEGSSMLLKAGDRLTIGELLLGVTTVSANDAAVMLSLAAVGSEDEWLDLMNANAAELGMRDTHFGTPNGWPDEGRTYTTARDLAVLAEAMTTRFPGLYRRYFGHRGLSYHNVAQANHDPITGRVEGADGMKTGFTRESGYNFLGSAERGGRRLVLVVAGSPYAGLRDKTARDLMNWGFDAFERHALLPADAAVGHALVQDGAQGAVALKTAQAVFASLPPGGRSGVTYSIRYRGPVEAPVEAGKQIAWLRVAIPGQEPHDVPLMAAEAVPQANALQRLVNGITGLFS